MNTPALVRRSKDSRRPRASESAIALALTGFAALFVAVRANRSAAVDLAITVKLQGWRSRRFQRLMAATSWPGFRPQSLVIPPVVVAAWWVSGRPLAATLQLGAWGAAGLSTVVKSIVRRPRPLPPAVAVAVSSLGGTSFPSGHVLTYVVFYGFLAHLVALHARPTPVRRAGVASLVGLLILIGPSRVEEGHHWTTDVVASYLLGLAYLLGLVRLYDHFRR